MFAEAVKLSLHTLSAGILVREAVVYGIMVAVHDHECAKLLKLKLIMTTVHAAFFDMVEHSPSLLYLIK